MKSTLNFVLVSLALSVFNVPALTQTVTLDPSFGNGGKVFTHISNLSDVGRAMIIQPDGKIIVGGYSFDSQYVYSMSLVRYNSNGTLDVSFGVNGIVRFHPSSGASECFSLALLPDGKILAGGFDWSYMQFFAIVRFKPNGIVDSSFGVNGVARTNFGANSNIVESLALQADEKIIAGGQQLKNVYNFDREMILARFESNGVLDTTFGNRGQVITDLNISDDECKSIAIQPDGKILAGGWGQQDLSSNRKNDFVVIRYNSNGNLDSTFDSDGIAQIDFWNGIQAGDDLLEELALLPDGKILVSGGERDGGVFKLARLNVTGNLDSSFGINGEAVFTDFSFTGSYTSLNILPNNSFYATGAISQGGNFCIMKYKENGTLDSSFGNNGYVISDLGNPNDYSYASIVQPDNKIVLAGTSGYGSEDNNSYDFSIARYIVGTALPITLSSFTATKKQTSVLLDWQTANEQNNTYFSIERSSKSNNNFKEVGRVNSKGNSYKPQQYSFEDSSPFNGSNYYRLKQVDADGKMTYSKVAFIDFSKADTIKLYPNPVKDVITLEGLNVSGKTNISIISLQGSVLAKTTTTNSTYTGNIKQLPAGTYYVRIEEGKNVSTIKFMKQ
jgi:uncharacterized delta-60 repeat protein